MPISIEADPTLAQGYIKVNGTTAATVTSTGLTTASLQNAAVTNAKLSLAANAGEVKKAINADNSPPIYACRAWVNFDGGKDSSGTASTANTNRFIRASGNVSSVLRNAAGDYTVTFATAMPDANYSVVASVSGFPAIANFNTTINAPHQDAASTTQVRMQAAAANTEATGDPEVISVAIFR
jgi:hypothetical protein